MEKKYCPRHPGVQLERERATSIALYCPRCKTEDENQQTQRALLSEQRATQNLLERQEVENQRETERQLGRKLLQEGLIEFDGEFQNEWERVVKRYLELSKLNTEADRITSSFHSEFYSKVKKETIPPEIVKRAECFIEMQVCADELTSLHVKIFNNTAKKLSVQNPGINIMRLSNTLDELRYQNVTSYPALPPSGKYSMMTAMVLILLGVACNSVCDGAIDVTRSSFKSVVFFWPAIFFLALFANKFIRRSIAAAKNSKLNSALMDFIYVIGELMLKVTINDDYQVKENLARVNSLLLRDMFSDYVKNGFCENSYSKEGAKLYNHITADGLHSTKQELKKDFEDYKNQYNYMKSKIKKIGKEIYDGHRVPARLKATRIHLLRCPSCGGPLADDGSRKCYYCGNAFTLE